MPKRPNPSEKAVKDSEKKPRTSSSSDDDVASLTDKISSTTSASTGRVSATVSRVAPAVIPPVAVVSATQVTVASSPKKTTSSSPKNIRGSGGNSFLKSIRTGSKTNCTEAKKPTSIDVPTKREYSVDHTTSNGSNIPTNKEPVVPFPRLPQNYESNLKAWVPISVLFILNIAAVIYISYQRSLNNLIQMKRALELNKLYDELAVSHNEVNILKQTMNGIEQAREARDKMLADDQEVFAGLFGPQVGGGGHLLTSEDRREWLEKMRLLEVDAQFALDEFNQNLF